MKTADENEINIAISAIDAAINDESIQNQKQLETTDEKIQNLQKQKEQIEQINKPHLKSEAAIVAALMGNSIVRLNKNRNRLLTQVSSPPAIQFTTATNDTNFLHASNQSLSRQKSRLSSHSQQTNDATNATDLEGCSTSNATFKHLSTSANFNKSNQANQKFTSTTTHNKASKCMLNHFFFIFLTILKFRRILKLKKKKFIES